MKMLKGLWYLIWALPVFITFVLVIIMVRIFFLGNRQQTREFFISVFLNYLLDD